MKSHQPKPPADKKPAPREPRTRRPMHRIYEIHARILSGSLPNCSNLAQALEVDRKTIQRDISFMRDALGLPLVYCEDLHGYRYDGDVSDFPVFEISSEELATLFFTRTALNGIRGTRLADALATAFAKITRGLLGKIDFTWSDLDEAFSHKSVQQDQSLIKCFGQLAKAILDQSETAFHYRKLEGEHAEPRKVRPLHLGEVDGGWYLIAHDLDRNALRTFALPRPADPLRAAGGFQWSRVSQPFVRRLECRRRRHAPHRPAGAAQLCRAAGPGTALASDPGSDAAQ